MRSSGTVLRRRWRGSRSACRVPKAVCVVSAHWVTRGSEVLAVAKPRTIHDFYGFPAPLYEVEYPAPGAPTEAERVARELEIRPDETWGFDHGAWSVLRHLYPEADVPVFQVSLDAGRSLARHVELGRRARRAARPRRVDSGKRQHRAQSAPFGG
jgi:4,5-DOPA dioxygenase extradiol